MKNNLIWVILFLFTPYTNSVGQTDTDNVASKADNYLKRIDAAETVLNIIAPKVESNSQKAQKVDSIISSLKQATATSTRVVYRTQTKRITVPVNVYKPVYRDTTLYIIDGQYVDKPIVIYKDPPKYGSSMPYLNFSQWRAMTGSNSSKEYLKYLKSKTN